jgi:hypothetical protein
MRLISLQLAHCFLWKHKQNIFAEAVVFVVYYNIFTYGPVDMEKVGEPGIPEGIKGYGILVLRSIC